jgi:hypothetical protein
MENGRRSFLWNFAVVLTGAEGFFATTQRRAPSRPPSMPRIPDAGASNGPMDDPPFPPRPDPKTQLKESQKHLRRDADRLLQLAQELKDEADKTEQTDVLSLSLVHKAEEVEKLAKQIKDLIRSA